MGIGSSYAFSRPPRSREDAAADRARILWSAGKQGSHRDHRGHRNLPSRSGSDDRARPDPACCARNDSGTLSVNSVSSVVNRSSARDRNAAPPDLAELDLRPTGVRSPSTGATGTAFVGREPVRPFLRGGFPGGSGHAAMATVAAPVDQQIIGGAARVALGVGAV